MKFCKGDEVIFYGTVVYKYFMIKKLIVSFFMFVLSFLFIGSLFIEAESIEVDVSNKSEPLDISNGNDHNVYFDCDSVFETNKSKINIRLIDDYKIIPEVSGNGNISFDIINSDYCLNEFELLLPQEDGKLELILYFGDELVRKIVYSSYKDGNYGVSTSSLYSAKKIIGNLLNQEYMDNDVNEGIYIPTPENVSSRDVELGNRGCGQITGTLRWEDDENQLHYLSGVKVKLDNLYCYTYTNSNGYYELPLNGYSGSCLLHIYAKDDKIEVKDDDYDIYEKAQILYVIDYIGYVFNYDFTRNIDDDLAGAMQIYMAANCYASFANSLLRINETIPSCNIVYPSTTVNGICAYYGSINTIKMCDESYRQEKCPSVAGSWDVIGHEYGHHLQHHFFPQSFGGTHYIGRNCLNTLFGTNNYSSINSLDDPRVLSLKEDANVVSFKEAWASFFSIIAQKSFNVGIIPKVGDEIYSAYNGSCIMDLSAIDNYGSGELQGGESDELIIARLLYKLWDNSQETWDTVSIPFATIWYFMCDNKPKNLSYFINDLYYDSSFATYYNGISSILEYYGISPNNLQIDQTNNYYVKPTFTWNSGNKDVEHNNLKFRFSNNEFVLEFYTPNGNLLFETGSIYSNIINNNIINTYTLTENQWNQIRVSNISSYRVRVKGYANYAIETGPYYSSYYSFNIPTCNDNIIVNANISNSRYYENSFIITAGTNRQFNITFDHSGNKLIQTFGGQDTKMYLYDSNNNLVVPMDDDSGYSSNSLVFAYLNSNTTYKLIVSLFNQTLTASTKLTIISYGGDYQNNSSITEYEEIHEISFTSSIYTYQTYVNQYEATVVIWRPNVTGCYTVELSSSFDNYLYVIDPTSSNYLVEDVDYNEDYCIDDDQGLYTSDAKLYGYYYNFITYMIVINQSYPSGNGGNINLIIDFLM